MRLNLNCEFGIKNNSFFNSKQSGEHVLDQEAVSSSTAQPKR